jgi:hypothetical protein
MTENKNFNINNKKNFSRNFNFKLDCRKYLNLTKKLNFQKITNLRLKVRMIKIVQFLGKKHICLSTQKSLDKNIKSLKVYILKSFIGKWVQ